MKIKLYIFLFTLLLSTLYSNENVIKVGLPNVPGLMFKNDNGKPKGVPLEITEQILNEENIDFIWIEGSWTEIFQLAKKGEIDVLPGTIVTEQRKKYFDYTSETLYLIWSEVFLRKNSNYQKIKDFENKKIGLVYNDNNAEGFEDYIENFHIDFQRVYFSSHKAAIDALKRKEIYGAVLPNPNVLNNLLGDELERSGLYFNPNELAIAFPKGKNPELIKIFDKKIKEYKNNPNSKYNELIAYYRVSHITPHQPFIPNWLLIALIVLVISVLIVFVFIIILKRQVNIKTKELKLRSDLLNKALLQGKMGSYVIDIKKRKLILSDELKILLGYDINEFDDSFENIPKFIHPDEKQYSDENFYEFINNESEINSEYNLINKNGKKIIIYNIGKIIKDKNNNPELLIGITQDITERKKYEQDLINAKEKAEQSEKLKTAFLANMSHEIRTPLNSIIGFTSLLEDDDISNKEKKFYIDIIKKQKNLLLKLINDVLDIAKIESGSIEINIENNINSKDLLNDIYNSFIKQIPENMQLIKKIPEIDINLITDKNRLKQILNNFVSNALKYSKNGNVEIGYRINKDNQKLRIYVKDDGPGISEEFKEKIFKRFEKLDEFSQGAGLGLSISKAIANLLKIDIGVDSDNIGSEFYIETKDYYVLNKIDDDKESEKNKNIEIDLNKNLDILIAEDNDSNYQLIFSYFKNTNYSLYRARTGQEVIKLMNEREFNIILMDIKMPDMDGLKVTRILRSRGYEIPIIAVTAYALQNDDTKAFEAGCNDYLTKPVSKTDLFKIISKYL